MKGIFPRFSPSEDVDRELHHHLEESVRELVAEGWEASAARDEALRRFGDVERVAGRCREIARRQAREERRSRMLETLGQDIRFGVRTLLRAPTFALVAVATLALGIGANTAIFSVVNGVVLRPLPYERPHELVWLREVSRGGGRMAVAWPNFRDWREEGTSFAGLAVFNAFSTTVLGGADPAVATVAMAGEDFWRVLSVQPVEGRLTLPSDHVPGAAPVVVVSHAFWQSQLGGAPVEGRTLELMGMEAEVVGVLPPRFDFPSGAEVWGPAEPFNTSESRTAHNWNVIGRLGQGVSLDRAREEIDAITKRGVSTAVDEDPDYLAVGAVLVPLSEQVVGDVTRPLWLLLGAAGLVLLVACVNLASTLLARGANRRRELAVRSSLGAARGRITRQLLTESVLLAGMGGAAGVALAYGAVEGIRALAPGFLPRVAEVGVDGTVLAYTAVVSLSTALLFGLLPARRLAREDAAAGLREGSRGNALDGREWVWRFLVGAEVALALVLLVGAGLLVRSFQTLLAEDAGVDASDVALLPVALSQVQYPEEGDHVRFHEGFLEEVGRLPGVSAAGLLSTLPVEGFPPTGRLELDGDVNEVADGAYVVASAGAFEALDIPLLQGRLFEPGDTPDRGHVAIVSRAFAERYWPGEDPIGRSVTGGGMDNFYVERTFATVVGVVGDVRHGGLGREPMPTVYFPFTQRPFRILYGATVVAEASSGDPSSILPALRTALRGAEPDVPLRERTLQAAVDETLGERRFVLLVLGGFSLTALLLAGVGIFGVVSYSVARRTREMGIRLALGAEPRSVLGMVMRGAMGMVILGLVVGVVGSLALTRTMRSLLYEVSPADPLAMVAALVLLGGAALLASWLPARAGTKVDPAVTMRAE